jgi:hypothetical protein
MTKETGTFLLLDGKVICTKCLDTADTIEKRLHVGETYGDEPCDRCVERLPHIYSTAQSNHTPAWASR